MFRQQLTIQEEYMVYENPVSALLISLIVICNGQFSSEWTSILEVKN